MSCTKRISRQVLAALSLAALLLVPAGAGAAPAERPAVTTSGGDGWIGWLAASWQTLGDLILSLTGADGTEDPPPPPPPPPQEEDELKPPNGPSCPQGQTGGPCVDPNG